MTNHRKGSASPQPWSWVEATVESGSAAEGLRVEIEREVRLEVINSRQAALAAERICSLGVVKPC